MDREVRLLGAMEGVVLAEPRSVLIVDPMEETREVLQTALQRRGVRTFSASRAAAGLELARRHHPDLIVLDLELDNSPPEEISAPFAKQSARDRTPLVMLGSIRRNEVSASRSEFVAKPYHYGPLVRRIEELLNTTPSGSPRGA